MVTVFFISDLHLGHKSILKFCPARGGEDVDGHSKWIVNQWNSVVSKGDVTYVLGDLCFDGSHLKYVRELRGQKILLLGNHDKFSNSKYAQYCNNIRGFQKKYGFWLSHPPIHPAELRGRRNIHGHVHQHSIPDERYINVCVDALDGVPVSLDELKAKYDDSI